MNATVPQGAPDITMELREPLLSWISDSHLALLLPVVMYWSVSLIFHALDVWELAEKYRIHTPKELESRNKCTVGEVVRAVMLQHSIQTLMGLLVERFDPPEMTGYEAFDVWKIQNNLNTTQFIAETCYYWIFPAVRLIFAFFLIDSWQYFLHRFMHQNKWAYRNFHSVHHRLYVPYAFGALYNSIIEGFALDTLGTFLASIATGCSTRENMILYTFSTLKTVDDHCGYEFPWDPLQIIFPNRATYHDIHHQHFGIKTNFAQPFFVHWDVLLGSKYEQTEAYIEKNRVMRIEAYEAKKQKEQEKKKA